MCVVVCVHMVGGPGTVSSSSFTWKEAKTICTQLGFLHASPTIGSVTHNVQQHPQWLNGLDCSGTPSILSNCSSNGLGNAAVSGNDVIIQCKNGERS